MKFKDEHAKEVLAIINQVEDTIERSIKLMISPEFPKDFMELGPQGIKDTPEEEQTEIIKEIISVIDRVGERMDLLDRLQ